MEKKGGRILRYTVSLSVACILVYFAFRKNDWQEFFYGLAHTNWLYIILSMLAAVVALVFRAERWRNQLLPLDGNVSRKSVWHGSNIGNFMSLAIPGVGEFYRCAHVSTAKASYDKTFGTILMERSWDVLAILVLLTGAALGNRQTIVPFLKENVIGPFAGRFSFPVWWLAGAVFILGAGAIACIFLLRNRSAFCSRVTVWLKGMTSGFASFGKIRNKTLFLIYTVGIWVMYILMTYLTFLAIPGFEGLTFSDAVFISAIGNIASVIPTPGNIGPYHYLVGLSISTIYLNASTIVAPALLCATLSHGSHALLLIIVGLESYLSSDMTAQH